MLSKLLKAFPGAFSSKESSDASDHANDGIDIGR